MMCQLGIYANNLISHTYFHSNFQLGYGLAEALGFDPAFAFGLITMACSPGGGSSNVWVKLLGGDLDLSLTMTSISTIAALGV